MNTTPPEQLFLETRECPDELLVMTSFEIGQLYEDIWDGD